MEWKKNLIYQKQKNLLKKYPQVKEHQLYESLCYKPNFHRTYIQVVIPNDKIREQMEAYSISSSMIIEQTNIEKILKGVKNRSSGRMSQLNQINHQEVH